LQTYFSKWKEGLGGNLDLMVSGSAALQPRLARIFAAAEIPVMEGYGLTETPVSLTILEIMVSGRYRRESN
jgi:long-chain acyl-CoA synthetase